MTKSGIPELRRIEHRILRHANPHYRLFVLLWRWTQMLIVLAAATALMWLLISHQHAIRERFVEWRWARAAERAIPAEELARMAPPRNRLPSKPRRGAT